MKAISRKYLSNAERSLAANGHNQRHLRADGWLQRQMGFTAQAESGQFFPANGVQGGGTMPGGTSQPIVLQISNTTSSTQTINLFGASVYLDTTVYTWASGNMTQNSVVISVISTTQSLNTYSSVLRQLLSRPMTIAKTTVQVVAGSNSQISQTWGLNTFAANANVAAQQFVNIPDPTQYRNDVINNFTVYDLDDSTYLQLSVLGSTTFQMLFYPIVDINLSRATIGQPAAKTFSPPPGNLAPQPVIIQQ
jgi:hypothetical protein